VETDRNGDHSILKIPYVTLNDSGLYSCLVFAHNWKISSKTMSKKLVFHESAELDVIGEIPSFFYNHFADEIKYDILSHQS